MQSTVDKRAHFEAIAQDWDARQAPEREQDLLSLLSSYTHLFAGTTRILEIGTGTGALIPAIKALGPKAWLVSIDLAHAMLRLAQAKNSQANLMQADGCCLPFDLRDAAETKFELVICHNAFPHFDDQPATLRTLLALLRPGGHLLILHDLSRQAVNGIHQRIGGAVGQDLLPNGEDLNVMMKQAGFVELQVEDGPDHFHAIGRRLD